MYANPPWAPMALFFSPFFPFNSRFENQMRAGCTELSHVCSFQLWQIGTVDASSSDLFIYLRGRREEGEGEMLVLEREKEQIQAKRDLNLKHCSLAHRIQIPPAWSAAASCLVRNSRQEIKPHGFPPHNRKSCGVLQLPLTNQHLTPRLMQLILGASKH